MTLSSEIPLNFCVKAHLKSSKFVGGNKGFPVLIYNL